MKKSLLVTNTLAYFEKIKIMSSKEEEGERGIYKEYFCRAKVIKLFLSILHFFRKRIFDFTQ
jgi:hypothetical protein